MKFKIIAKYFVLLSRNNPLMFKGLKSVNLRIIQMYHFRLNGMHELVGRQLFWGGTPTFSSGTPTFCLMGGLNSCFQNPSESSDIC